MTMAHRMRLSIVMSLIAFRAMAAEPVDVAFFESKVRPILVDQCYSCHSDKKQKGGLRVDSREAIRKGGESGAVIVVGKPDESRLINAVRHRDKNLKMPPDKKLQAEQIAALEQWIAMGAPDPRDSPPNADASSEWDAIVRERQNWWSLQPVRRITPPDVMNSKWVANPVDQFILSKLESAKLEPAKPADRVVLARRLSFLLTGLPPTPEQVREFANDGEHDAVDRVVDRLLGDPAFGERWARHWMDVVRFSDTYGYEWDIPARGSWRYRDYLIRAFNGEVPFDQLVREQIAGDLLKQPRINRVEGINESRIGPMFFQLGEKRHGDSAEFNGIHQEMLDNKIDAFSKAFQATTIACARCHDHKLDAVSQRDYYALGGLFMSSRWVANTVDTPERNRQVIVRLGELKKELRRAIGEWWLGELKTLPADTWSRAVAETTNAPLPLEHPMRPWQVLAKSNQNGGDIAKSWRELAMLYSTETQKRSADNTAKFQVIGDFGKGMPPGWSVDGDGARTLVKAGDFTVALDGNRAIGRLLSSGLATDSLSPRLNGALRSPMLRQINRKFVSVLVQGGDFAAQRTIVDNAFLTERQSYLTPEPGWKQFSTFPDMKERGIYVEFATKASNPNFPPRVGLGPDLTEAQINDPRSWFAVTRIVAHDTPGTPADELTRFAALFAGEAPKSMVEVQDRYAAWLRDAVDAWTSDRASDDQVAIMNWLLKSGFLPNSERLPPHVVRIQSDYRAEEKTLRDPQTANGLAAIDASEDYRLNLRGDYDRLGPAVPRGYLQIFAKANVRDRLGLANFVASADNPLTARVYVNRVWHWVFGAGLVATPDDFGHLGDRPSHPELLDWLATWFVDNGWSTKKLIRLLVTSNTFQQSDVASESAQTADPRNRLCHHFELRRMEAEAVRDSLLAASGRLDRRLFGPSINPHRTAEDPQKRLFSGPLDGNGRRSIYTKSTIMDPPRFLAAFNQPPAKIPTGKRDVTNVPAQALAMLNDPFVIGQADEWGKRLAGIKHGTIADRLREMFDAGLSREPTSFEIENWSRLIRDLANEHRVADSAILVSPAIWKDAAHALFNTKEFIYIR